MDPYGTPESRDHRMSEEEVERRVEEFRKELYDGSKGGKFMEYFGKFLAAVLASVLFVFVIVLFVAASAWLIRKSFGL